MSNITLIIVIVVAVAIIVALVVAGAQMARRKRTEQLRQQYGPEYDRAIDESDSQRAAESELRDRAKRHDELELRTLDSSERGGLRPALDRGPGRVRGRPEYRRTRC
jgi:FtsZ-interacting cell division protein ZipA